MKNVGIAGFGQTKGVTRRTDVTFPELVKEGADLALADAQMTIADIDAVVYPLAPDALAGVTGCVQELLGDGDRLVRLADEDFLAVLPSWSPDRVRAFCDDACAGIGELDQVYPFVALPAAAAATVTRSRPLPLDELREQVGRRNVGAEQVEVPAG